MLRYRRLATWSIASLTFALAFAVHPAKPAAAGTSPFMIDSVASGTSDSQGIYLVPGRSLRISVSGGQGAQYEVAVALARESAPKHTVPVFRKLASGTAGKTGKYRPRVTLPKTMVVRNVRKQISKKIHWPRRSEAVFKICLVGDTDTGGCRLFAVRVRR